MKFKKKIQMFEDFASSADASNSTTPSSATTKTTVAVDKTNTKSGEAIRQEVIKDVDTILTNLAELSNQITESYAVNENMDELLKGLKSTFAVAKAEMMMGDYEKLLKAADPTNQKNQVSIATAKMTKKIDQLTKSVEGKGISPEVREKAAKDKQKLKDEMAGATEAAAVQTEKAKNALEEFKSKLGNVEADITKGSKLDVAYQAKKARIANAVREEAMEEAAKIAAKLGKDDAAKELAEELEEIKKRSAELEAKIKKGESLAKEEIAELAGVKAYMAEIEAIMKAREDVNKVVSSAKEATEAIKESLLAFNNVILESAVEDLFSKAKSKSDEAALGKAKQLANAIKTAATAELAAVSALANKIKGQEVTKSVIGLAGGDMDKAQEGEKGFKLGEFIPKYGDGTSLKKPEDLAAVKSADEVLNKVDQAIADAIEGGDPPAGDPPAGDPPAGDPPAGGEEELTDDQKEEIRQKIQKLEAKIASGEGKKEGKPEDVKQKIEQSLAAKRTELENLKAQLGESFGSYEKTMAILTEMESSIDAILREYDRVEPITESFAFKSGSVADRFRSLM